MSAYVDGVEINKIPELAQVCKMDDWLSGLMDWAKKNRSSMNCDLIIQGNSFPLDDAPILEIWIGGAPRFRAQQIGGVLQSLKCSPKDPEK